MALVGQIVTVSDVLMDGTVNNYIMGADANIFQTNYNSSGVMTDWSIGDAANGTMIQGDSSSFLLDTWNGSYRVQRIQANNSTITLGETFSPTNAFFILNQQSAQLACSQMSFNLSQREFSLRSTGGIVQIEGSAGMTSNYLHLEASNYAFNMSDNTMFIGPKTGSNYIYYSGNSRPYFGTCASNYLIGKTDLDSAISTGTSGMATQTWVSQNYQPAGSYAAADHTHNYQLPIPTDSSGFYQINITGTAGYATSAGSAMTATSALNFSTDLGPVGTNFVGTNSRYNGIYFKIGGQVDIPGLWLGGNDGRQLHVGHINYWPDVYLSGTTYHLEGNLASHSDYRIKEDIKYIKADEIKNFYYNLKPASYIMKKDKLQRHNFGFIAQDVINSGIDKNFYNGIYSYDKEEDLYSLNYFQFIPLNTLMIQEQHQEIETLKAEIAEIKELLKNK